MRIRRLLVLAFLIALPPATAPAQVESKLAFESSDERLNAGFNWARKQALATPSTEIALSVCLATMHGPGKRPRNRY